MAEKKEKRYVSDNAQLMSEWNWEKNKEESNISPEILTLGSNRKVWWKCSKGHEWETTPASRSRGTKCPFCSGNRVLSGYNDLLSQNPELSKEWNYEKNGELTPDKISPFSNRKVWWKCEKGHEWLAVIGNRSNGNGCPWCANQGNYVLPEKSLAVLKPELVKEWNYEKNVDITPDKVSLGSNKKVWWKCQRGHEWQASITNRVRGRNCRQCSIELKSSFPEQLIIYYLSKFFDVESRKIINDWEIDVFIPEFSIGIEYDGIAYHNKFFQMDRENRKNIALEKNIDLIRVKENYDKNQIEENVIWFIVDSQYTKLEWAVFKLIRIIEQKTNMKLPIDVNINRDRIEILSNYRIIERRNSFASNFPELLKYWNVSKNKDLIPENFSRSSNFSVWWKCPICNGEWQENINLFSRYRNCPYCSNRKLLTGFNDLETKNPELLKEWDYDKNNGLIPSGIMHCSTKLVWWKCQNGHSWKASPSQRTRVGTGCAKCNCKGHVVKKRDEKDKRLLVEFYPDLVNEWDYEKNLNIDINTVFDVSTQRVYWKCEKGHSWEAPVYNRAITKTGCPVCKGRIGWEGYFDLLLNYYKTNGHINMEAKYTTEDGFKLG